MKRISKALAILTATCSLALCLIACGGGNSASSSDRNSSSNSDQPAYKIGILQFAQHDALSATHEGFVQELDRAGIKHEITADINASGNRSACQAAAQKLVSGGNDLILAIATPAVEDCTSATSHMPIVYPRSTKHETVANDQTAKALGVDLSVLD